MEEAMKDDSAEEKPVTFTLTQIQKTVLAGIKIAVLEAGDPIRVYIDIPRRTGKTLLTTWIAKDPSMLPKPLCDATSILRLTPCQEGWHPKSGIYNLTVSIRGLCYAACDREPSSFTTWLRASSKILEKANASDLIIFDEGTVSDSLREDVALICRKWPKTPMILISTGYPKYAPVPGFSSLKITPWCDTCLETYHKSVRKRALCPHSEGLPPTQKLAL